MEASILIVSKNRKDELSRTLHLLSKYLDFKKHEILVLLDNCNDHSDELISEYDNVSWFNSNASLGASRARSVLYKKAKGRILFGFDDDAHPLQSDFIKITDQIFRDNENIGLISFKEIKGVFRSDSDLEKNLLEALPDFKTNDFVGCGFAVLKNVYDRTRGFPEWIDIYGEEQCLAMEILDLGYDLIYTHKIQVNHRVDLNERKRRKANYFRFARQLRNTSYFYLVYYPFPLLLKKIGRLYFLNFKKYGLKDRRFFIEFWKALGTNFLSLGKIIKKRRPVKRETILKFNKLSKPLY